MRKLNLLFIAMTLSSASLVAQASGDDPLSHFPVGSWVGTYTAQDCVSGEKVSGPATLKIANQTYYAGTPVSSVVFNGALVLAGFPDNYNSYSTGVNLKTDQNSVAGTGSPYMVNFSPEQGAAFVSMTGYYPSTGELWATVDCSHGKYNVSVDVWQPAS